MTTAKKPRKRLSARDKVLKQWGDAFLGRENPKPRKRRETPEQRAERRLKCRTCGAGFLSKAGQAPCPKPTPGKEYVDTGRGNHVFTKEGPPPKPKRETPEQKARRVGKGLGLYLLPADGGSWEVWRRDDGGHFYFNGFAGGTAIALWRALARERGVRL